MSILQEIFETKRKEIREAKSRIDLQEIIEQISHRPLGFRKALLDSLYEPSLIAEIKKASPSQGNIFEGDFQPAEIAKRYEQAGAACLSVLTDEKYFHGSPEYLRQVRSATSLPLLRKDFMCDSYQIDEALAWGADCILLIVAGIDRFLLLDLFEEAQHKELDVLVEVHDEAETEFAVTIGADLIGINNRDLRTFQTDLSTTERCISLIPSNVLVVSESALATREDVERVRDAGARSVLIGTSFMAAPNLEQKVREILGEPVVL